MGHGALEPRFLRNLLKTRKLLRMTNYKSNLDSRSDLADHQTWQIYLSSCLVPYQVDLHYTALRASELDTESGGVKATLYRDRCGERVLDCLIGLGNLSPVLELA